MRDREKQRQYFIGAVRWSSAGTEYLQPTAMRQRICVCVCACVYVPVCVREKERDGDSKNEANIKLKPTTETQNLRKRRNGRDVCEMWFLCFLPKTRLSVFAG